MIVPDWSVPATIEEITADKAFRIDAKKLVEVEFVKVELIVFKFVAEIAPAEVIVALPPIVRFPEA